MIQREAEATEFTNSSFVKKSPIQNEEVVRIVRPIEGNAEAIIPLANSYVTDVLIVYAPLRRGFKNILSNAPNFPPPKPILKVAAPFNPPDKLAEINPYKT